MNSKEVCDFYLNCVSETITYLTFCRDIDLQKAKVKELEKHVIIFKNFKKQAVNNQKDELANFWFGCHNYLNTLKSCIESIILLKENNPHKAWDKLICAERFYSWASKIQDCLINEFDLEDYMREMENVLFPHFKIYTSIGFTATKGDCSVCLKKIDECEHIEGEIYSGYACFEINKKLIEIKDFAAVKNPEDRRCVPTEMSQGNFMIDYFTLKTIRKLNEEEKNTVKNNPLLVNWVMMSLEDVDIN